MCLHSNKQHGFSFLELVLVITIIGVLFTVAADRLLVLKVEAERTSMLQIIGALRSAMSIQVAKQISSGNVDNLPSMAGTNPMNWLAEKPENYIGIKDEPDPADINQYKWYFDSYNNWLVYRVGNSDYFKSSLKGAPRARFRVNLDYTDINENGDFDFGTDEIHGLTLQSVEPYAWQAEPINVDNYTSRTDIATQAADK